MEATPSSHASLAAQVARGQGPKDPFDPRSDIEVLLDHPSGAQVIRQCYEDGYLYEYQVPDGTSLDKGLAYYLFPPFRGRIIRTWSEENTSFYAVWITHEEVNAIPRATVVVPELKGKEPCSLPELVKEGDRFTLDRLRCDDGWIYRLKMPLGRPWPAFAFNPEMAPTRDAPIVGVEAGEDDFTAMFWVSKESLRHLSEVR